MHEHRWAVRVSGNDETLQALSFLLDGAPAQLRAETLSNSEEGAALLRRLEAGEPWPVLTAHPGWILRSEGLNTIDDVDEVRARADAMLQRATSILNVFVGGHEAPGVGPIVCRREDGTSHGVQISLTVEILTVSNAEAARLDADRERLQSAFGAQLMRAASDSDRAAEALAFLRDDDPGWPAMYAAVEAVALDLRSRGSTRSDFDPVAERGWCSKAEIGLFKRTANIFRHAHRREAPAKPMSIERARWLVKSIVRQWLEGLAAA
jgi:hypothetical protein